MIFRRKFLHRSQRDYYAFDIDMSPTREFNKREGSRSINSFKEPRDIRGGIWETFHRYVYSYFFLLHI
jgi:hypothetical protein